VHEAGPKPADCFVGSTANNGSDELDRRAPCEGLRIASSSLCETGERTTRPQTAAFLIHTVHTCCVEPRIRLFTRQTIYRPIEVRKHQIVSVQYVDQLAFASFDTRVEVSNSSDVLPVSMKDNAIAGYLSDH
jgi:hypothetical protein